MTRRAVIIGAGLGGMALAARLAHAGYETDVFEQACRPGGKAGEIRRDGFRFDAGPSVLTMPFVLDQLFAEVGEPWPESLDLVPLPLTCRYYFADRTRIDAWQDPAAFAREVGERTADSAADLERYLDHVRRLYELSAPVFLFRPFPSLEAWRAADALKSPSTPRDLDLFRSMHTANASFFKDPRNQLMADRFATYNGSSPFRAPATLNQIFHVEQAMGSYGIRGGIYSLSDHLYRLAVKLGARFFFETPVTRILTRGRKVAGVQAGGREERADLVASNADVLTTYTRLLDRPSRFMEKRYRWLGLSSSALVFYWGVEGTTPELSRNTVFFGTNYPQEFDALFKKKRYALDPTVYVHLSCRTNPGDAPEGHENWFVMVNAPARPEPDADPEITRVREAVLRRLASHGIMLRDRILFEEKLTPKRIAESTSSFGGSLYGLSSNRAVTAFLRHPARSRRFKNLFFCGGSVHPGGGMPLALLSARLAFERIAGGEKGSARAF